MTGMMVNTTGATIKLVRILIRILIFFQQFARQRVYVISTLYIWDIIVVL